MPSSKIEIYQELISRGAIDQIPADKRSIVDELISRGAIKAPEPVAPQQEPSMVEKMMGAGEVGMTVMSSAVAEPLAGLAGMAQAANPLADQGAGSEAVGYVREALTYDPRTETGREYLQATGEAVAPVAQKFEQAETALGDSVYEATGSEALAAAASTIPTLATEVLGLGLGKGGVRLSKRIKKNREAGQIARDINNALPSKDQLLDTSRAIFKEIDETGAVLKQSPYKKMVKQVEKIAESKGIDADITPNSAKALQRLQESSGKQLTLTELDNLREVAKNAISAGGKDGMIAGRFVDEIDNLLNTVNNKSFVTGEGVAEIGKKYRVARDLWGRAKRSEMLEESFEKARNQASGFENGVRVQFRSILNNKNKRKFFKPDEIAAMNRVVRGDTPENIARLIGRFGFTEGGAHNVITAMSGVGAGAVAAGPMGAMVVPLVGQVSRKLAQRMTIKNAEFADSVIKAGKDAEKIAKAYKKHTPKGQRDPAELSELLMKGDIDLSGLKSDELLEQAVQIAQEKKGAAIGASGAAIVLGEENEQ